MNSKIAITFRPAPALLLGLAFSGAFLVDTARAADAPKVESNKVAEISFEGAKPHPDPFMQVTLDVEFTDPSGAKKLVPAFWAGKNQWKVLHASPLVGVHPWRSICNAADDAGLHGVEGKIEITPNTGTNPLYLRGPIRVALDRRHFEHADGTPFFWLGDTWWKGLCKRMTWAGFEKLAADRKAKSFSVVQIVCGTYPDEPGLLKPSWEKEGGTPYGTHVKLVIPELTRIADYFEKEEKDFPAELMAMKAKCVRDTILAIEASTDRPELIRLK